MIEAKYYPVSRFRKALTQDYVSEVVENGLEGFPTHKEAISALLRGDIDDCDYQVCVNLGGEWFATDDDENYRLV